MFKYWFLGTPPTGTGGVVGGCSPEEEIESQSLLELLRLKEIKQEKKLTVHLSLYHSPFVPRGGGQHMAILILLHHLQSSIGPIREKSKPFCALSTILRPGCRQVDVQCSTNSWTCVHRVYSLFRNPFWQQNNSLSLCKKHIRSNWC